MKLLLALLLGISFTATGQDSTQILQQFNADRTYINRSGMRILGSWALLNMGVGLAGDFTSTAGSEQQYYYQMSWIWNTVNLGLAIPGFLAARNENYASYDLLTSLDKQHKIEKILLFNTALDLAYITTGLYLQERGMHEQDLRLKGYGNNLMIQGGFLLLFDAWMSARHIYHFRKNKKALYSISPAQTGIGFRIKW